MTKSGDLKARPIFHSLKASIEAHLLIVSTALVVSRYIEIVTRTSIPKIISTLSRVKQIIIEDPVSGCKEETQQLLQKTDVWVT